MKKNGFIVIETIIMICFLCITIIYLYSSYTHIMSKVTDTSYEAIENNYLAKEILTKVLIDKVNGSNFYEIYKNSDSYVIKDSSDVLTDDIKNVLEFQDIEKVYIFKDLSTYLSDDNLLKFDGTTINYINSIKNKITVDYKDLIIIKKVDKTFGYYANKVIKVKP